MKKDLPGHAFPVTEEDSPCRAYAVKNVVPECRLRARGWNEHKELEGRVSLDMAQGDLDRLLISRQAGSRDTRVRSLAGEQVHI